MAKELSVLQQQAEAIKNEVNKGANTANRVGSMFSDMLDYNEEQSVTDKANTGISTFPVFSEVTAYTVDQVVNYNDKLYKFTADHPAGAWNSAHVAPTSLKEIQDEKLTELEGKINEYNVSVNNPNNGESGSNVYDLNSAILQVPSKYRVVGMKVTFYNKDHDVESWVYNGHGWVVGNFDDVSPNKIAEAGYFGCTQDTYVNDKCIIGKIVSINSAKGSINCSNLLSIKKVKEDSAIEFNIYNLYNSTSVPSYVIVDKNLIVLSIVKQVSTAKISQTDLPDNAAYLIANSKSGNSVVYSDKYGSLIDSGISILTALETNKLQSISTKVDALDSNIESLTDSIYTEGTILTRDEDVIADKSISNYFLISRIINTFGGKVLNLVCDFDTLESKTFDICVLLKDSDGKFEVKSKTSVEVSSKNMDLSSYNITLPAGDVMVSLFIDTQSFPDVFKYGLTKPENYTESKAIQTSSSINVGNKYSLSSFDYIYPNFYFEIYSKLKIKDEVEKNTEDLSTLSTEFTNLQTIVKDLQNKSVDDRFKDKNVVIFGDSITNLGGDNLTGKRGWTTYFKEHFEFKSIRSYARSGATMTATVDTIYDIEENVGNISPNNCLYNQVNRMIDAINKKEQEIPNYIFVALGTNDRTRGYDSVNDEITVADSLGTDYSTEININTCTTFIKAMRYFHDQIWNITKDVQIIILTPLQRFDNLQDTYKAASQIKKIANFLAWPVIDLFSETCLSCVSENLGYTKNNSEYDYTIDGIHPTERGAKFNGDFIAQKAKSIMRI